METHYRPPQVSITSNESDIYFFIEDYEEASTDPPLTILMNTLVNEKMNGQEPSSTDSKYYRIGNGTDLHEEIDPNDKDQLLDFYENIVTTKYFNDKYEFTHIENNIECGASGVFEVILISVISGAVSGITGSIATSLIKTYGKDNNEPNDCSGQVNLYTLIG